MENRRSSHFPTHTPTFPTLLIPHSHLEIDKSVVCSLAPSVLHGTQAYQRECSRQEDDWDKKTHACK